MLIRTYLFLDQIYPLYTDIMRPVANRIIRYGSSTFLKKIPHEIPVRKIAILKILSCHHVNVVFLKMFIPAVYAYTLKS